MTSSAFRFLSRTSRSEKALFLIFVLSLPLANPWVRGDGVGYYAYARALLIEHRLDFTKDWQHGNESFTMGRIGADGRIDPQEFTKTGHISNNWTIGPALLWLPFLAVTHAGVLAADAMGAHVAADGFSWPYIEVMALTTALYGFLGLWISFRLARGYFSEAWALLATVGIWWASSLPVYMYFNPSWSHAHSAFVAALLLWYWHRTRKERTWKQWIVLGLISGLAVDIYYINGVLLLVPLLEAISKYGKLWRLNAGWMAAGRLFAKHVLYLGSFGVALLPTLISLDVIYGSPFSTGYPTVGSWSWHAPAFLSVLFSSDHGLLSWTPILGIALIGLAAFSRSDRAFAAYLAVSVAAFFAVVALHPDWDGLSSFGNRFFISLTPIFILGLAAFFEWLSRIWREDRVLRAGVAATALLIVWNQGLIFQWGTHLIPARGPISFRQAAYNQVAVVPVEVASTVKRYFLRRHQLMNRIENEDVHQLKSGEPDGND
ncbi:MAG TPA: glycosyltransferase family 39 protein [Verrucomicrobiae bacterium]|nr:glycosyltransferase family 39 protein [Verrucomicrobiae bacterium]